jgi:glycerophosphoryl diester phosphodiesterase
MSGGAAARSQLPRPLVIAHRGASGYRPENTLPAYELAIEQGADMIEIDLHRTRDAATVVTHDESLEHLGGRGEIAEASLAEIHSLDAGGGERVPTLDEVLDHFGSRIPFNLELKSGGRGAYAGLETAALESVRLRGLLGQTLFSSFYDPVLQRLRELEPKARIGLLLSARAPARPIDRARAVRAESLNPWLGLASRQLVDRAHAAGLRVYPYTVNEERDMRRLLARGVDGMFTNYPDRLRSLTDLPEGNRHEGTSASERR